MVAVTNLTPTVGKNLFQIQFQVVSYEGIEKNKTGKIAWASLCAICMFLPFNI